MNGQVCAPIDRAKWQRDVISFRRGSQSESEAAAEVALSIREAFTNDSHRNLKWERVWVFTPTHEDGTVGRYTGMLHVSLHRPIALPQGVRPRSVGIAVDGPP